MANSTNNKDLSSYISGIHIWKGKDGEGRESSFPSWSGPEPKVRLRAQGRALCPRSDFVPKGQRKSEPSQDESMRRTTSSCPGKEKQRPEQQQTKEHLLRARGGRGQGEQGIFYCETLQAYIKVPKIIKLAYLSLRFIHY